MGLFGRKKPRDDENIQEVKRIVAEEMPESQEPREKSAVERLFERSKMEESPASQIKENEEEPEFKQETKVETMPEIRPETRFVETKVVEKPTFAPLFVKIDRYRQILNSVGSLKTANMIIKNSLMTLRELDKARDETFKLIQDGIDKMEKRLNSLDQELIRPSGFCDMAEKPEYQDIETIGATIAGLKGEIEQLRTELNTD
jgi:hypothetical protein